MKTKVIRSGALELYTEAFGEPAKGAYVLIAGAMAPARFWTDAFCEGLASKGRGVIRYDHRDMGLSSAVDWDRAPYTLRDLAADAIAVLDGYGIKTAYFVGHSMGGHICQQLALDFPTRMVGFTPISSGPIGATKDTDIPLTESEKATLDATWKVFLSRKESDQLMERVDGFMAVWRYLNGTVPFDEAMARAYTIDLLTRTKHPIRAGNNHELVMRDVHGSISKLRNVLENISVPALIIHGDSDPIALPRDAHAMANAIPHSHLVMRPGMGHMFFNRELEREICQHILQGK